MTDQELNHFKELLYTQQQELESLEQASRESTGTVNLDQSSVGRLSRMDALQSQAMALETKRRRQVQVTRIKAALERLEEGEFGYCAFCDEEIGRRRLEIDPANPFCVECAAKL